MEDLKTKKFIEKATKVHDNKYIYDKVKYINNHAKVIIECKKHGFFLQSPSKHLHGQKCPSCSGVKKITQKEFIERAKEVHKNFYDYSLSVFKNVNSKIKIICPIHGEFEQRADHHLEGHKCKKCSCKSEKNIKKIENSFNIFLKKATDKWGNKYDYSKIIYKNPKTKVKIICPIHGGFYQSTDTHLKHECLKCSIEKNANNQRHDTNRFIEKAKKIHGEIYDYSKVDYKDNRIKVEIVCKEHGSFFQTPYNHLQNKGCLHCKNKSKGEEKIQKFLSENEFTFKRQKTFHDCINPETKKRLRFDFYLIKENICIEYDGHQHFNPIEFWGGESALNDNIKKDNIKNEYCKNHNIRLVRINYRENVVEVLNRELF